VINGALYAVPPGSRERSGTRSSSPMTAVRLREPRCLERWSAPGDRREGAGHAPFIRETRPAWESGLTVEQLSRAASSGDAIAARAFAETGAIWDRLTNVVHVLAPEAIAIAAPSRPREI